MSAGQIQLMTSLCLTKSFLNNDNLLLIEDYKVVGVYVPHDELAVHMARYDHVRVLAVDHATNFHPQLVVQYVYHTHVFLVPYTDFVVLTGSHDSVN
jgi:hypothetical protein